MAKGDGPLKIVQNVGDNAYKIEVLGDVNIFVTLNVGDLMRYIENEDEKIKDLRVYPLQEGKVDAKQAAQSNFLNNVNALARIGLTMIYENGIQGLSTLKSFLTSGHEKVKASLKRWQGT